MIFLPLALIQIALLVCAFIWMFKRNDEIPLLTSGFLLYVASYRYWVLNTGRGHKVSLENFGFAPITADRALEALCYIVLGEVFFIGTYMWRQKDRVPIMPRKADPELLEWLRPKAVFVGLVSLPLVLLARRRVMAGVEVGQSLAFEISSYLFLLPLMLVGIATVILCIWRFGGMPTLGSKIAAILILCGLAQLSFSSTGRFQFLGWMIAGGVILSSGYHPKKRLTILIVMAVAAMTLFAVAGALRAEPEDSGEVKTLAWQRAFSAEDANMLDGFVLLQQVYPKLLPFGHGMEHLEILFRPIPRSWWPAKPVGGYMSKLNLISSTEGFTIGISPTLFGSFYGEGGGVGVVVGSVLYAIALAGVLRLAGRMKPFATMLIRATVCASLIPLLRGGDLPGIYSWIGMAFWPCLLVLLWKFKELLPEYSPNGDNDANEDALPELRSMLNLSHEPPPPGKKRVSRNIKPLRSGDPSRE